ncbi:MAG: ACT domain-containing protein [Candidatus Marinimicrobia bacterium]|nr:ACT domain-containing protein [Candidatus Neomarinimicrobiota bacterium]
MNKLKIGGILSQKGLVMLKLLGIPNQPGFAGRILTVLGEENINLHFIAENEDIRNRGNITICVSDDQETKALSLLREHSQDWKQITLSSEEHISALTVYGPHFREKPAICGKMCSTLGLNNVNILGMSTSISSICCLISDQDYDKAYSALLDVFELP